MKTLLLITAALALSACGSSSTAQDQKQQISAGEQVFNANCQVCHGSKAAGIVKDWQNPGADGKYPAPPLNGSAHAWHHNMKTLLGTIDRGGIPLGGSMPSFKGKLTDDEKTAVIAYIQSLWPKEIFDIWEKRNG